MYWWLLPEPKYLYHIGAVVGVSDAQRSKMCCTPCSALCRSARIEASLHPISQHQCSPEVVYNAKKKYASYTMGGCSDLAVDIKMDGQDKINHNCKVYRLFFAARPMHPLYQYLPNLPAGGRPKTRPNATLFAVCAGINNLT